jgi:crossover junction endodeoxyribonuclease RuvC
MPMARLLGLDPGLHVTGWGMVESDGNRLRHLAHGIIVTGERDPVPLRLKSLYDALLALCQTWQPEEAAVEETYVNRNGSATLKLGYARGVILLVPTLSGIPVAEYGAKTVKKSVVGIGNAAKTQVAMMVRRLLPDVAHQHTETLDATDALAVAICHAHHRSTRRHWVAA